MKLIGLFTSDAAVVVNVFFLLTFPLVGLAAYLVLRRLTVTPFVAIACSILYTLMPYHFYRGEMHLVLSAYYVVPLGAYLVLAVLGDRPLWGRWRLTLTTLALCAVIAFASAGYYYAAFTVILVAAVAVIRAVVDPQQAAAQGGRAGGGGDPRPVARDSRAVRRLLGEARHQRRGNSSVAVRVGALRAQAHAARVASRPAPDRLARGLEAGLRKLVSGDRGDAQHAARGGCDAGVALAACGLALAAGVPGEASRPACSTARPRSRLCWRSSLRGPGGSRSGSPESGRRFAPGIGYRSSSGSSPCSPWGSCSTALSER